MQATARPATGSGCSTAVAARFGCIGRTSVVGLGLFTFQYADGLSYLSTDPAACANCHIMRETFDDWNRGEHAHAATPARTRSAVRLDAVGAWIAGSRRDLRNAWIGSVISSW